MLTKRKQQYILNRSIENPKHLVNFVAITHTNFKILPKAQRCMKLDKQTIADKKDYMI